MVGRDLGVFGLWSLVVSGWLLRGGGSRPVAFGGRWTGVRGSLRAEGKCESPKPEVPHNPPLCNKHASMGRPAIQRIAVGDVSSLPEVSE